MCGRKIIDRSRKRQRQYAIQTGYDYDYIDVTTRQIFNALVTFAGENEQKNENIRLSFIKDIFYKITNQTYVGEHYIRLYHISNLSVFIMD